MSLPNPITLLIIIVICFGLLALAVVILKAVMASGSEAGATEEYRLKPSLFSAAERSFLGVLESLEFKGMSLAYKVRLADVFEVKKGYDRSRWQRAFNRISAKHIDFLFVRETDGKPVVGIELDDKSHQKTKRIERDKLVDGVFESAGLPLLRIKAQATYGPRQVQTQILEAITPAEENPSS